MAGIKKPIQDILTTLKTVQDVQLVRMYNNQFSLLENGELASIPFPCLFLELVTPIEFTPLGNKVTQADLIFKVHIGHQQYNAGDGDFDENLDVYDLRDNVVQTLTNYSPTACTPLFKINEYPDVNHGNVYHYTIEFKTGYLDSSGSPYDTDNFGFIELDPPIALELEVTKNPLVKFFQSLFK